MVWERVARSLYKRGVFTYIHDASVKIFPSSETGLISINGNFGYLLAFICYEAFTQTFDIVERNLSDCSSSRNNEFS